MPRNPILTDAEVTAFLDRPLRSVTLTEFTGLLESHIELSRALRDKRRRARQQQPITVERAQRDEINELRRHVRRLQSAIDSTVAAPTDELAS